MILEEKIVKKKERKGPLTTIWLKSNRGASALSRSITVGYFWACRRLRLAKTGDFPEWAPLTSCSEWLPARMSEGRSSSKMVDEAEATNRHKKKVHKGPAMSSEEKTAGCDNKGKIRWKDRSGPSWNFKVTLVSVFYILSRRPFYKVQDQVLVSGEMAAFRFESAAHAHAVALRAFWRRPRAAWLGTLVQRRVASEIARRASKLSSAWSWPIMNEPRAWLGGDRCIYGQCAWETREKRDYHGMVVDVISIIRSWEMCRPPGTVTARTVAT